MHPKFCQKVPCERVTVSHSECARVQLHLLVDVEMEQVVELAFIWRRQWDTVATNECSYDRDHQHTIGNKWVWKLS